MAAALTILVLGVGISAWAYLIRPKPQAADRFLAAVNADTDTKTLELSEADLLRLGYEICQATDDADGDGIDALAKVTVDRLMNSGDLLAAVADPDNSENMQSIGRGGAFTTVAIAGWKYLCPGSATDEVTQRLLSKAP